MELEPRPSGQSRCLSPPSRSRPIARAASAFDRPQNPNPKIAILGPFSQAVKAQREGEKWTKLGNEAIENNETVPSDVRTYITEGIRKTIREQGVKALMKNATFGQYSSEQQQGTYDESGEDQGE